MITAKHRFHGLGSMRHVYKNGQIVRGPVFGVKYLLNPKRTQYRLAVVVAKRVHKSAVARNRMRRRIFEAVRSQEPQIEQAWDVVITVFDEKLLTISGPELETMVKSQLARAGITKAQRAKM